MISKKALEAYMARPLKDSGLVKRLDEARLDELLDALGLEWHTTPRLAQKVCLLLGWKYESYLFLLGMGGGKSKVSLDLFSNRKRVGDARRMLVLVPNVINLGEWIEQARLHAPALRCEMLTGKGDKQRWAQLEGTADVVVATYAGIGRLCSKPEKGRDSRRSWKPAPNKCDRLADAFEFLVLDESTAVKNPTTLWFKVLRRVCRNVRFRYPLTGTPFDKEPVDCWSQFYLVDGGETLGESLGLFREVWCRKEQRYFGGPDYVFRKNLSSDFARRLRNRSVRYKESECQDLPPLVGGLDGDLMLVPVQLPAAQLPYYRKIATTYRESRGDWQLCDNAYTRMRMVASGWLGAVTEEGEKVEVTFKDNPMLDAVVDLVRRLEEHKVVVVAWFNVTCAMILERLKKEKIDAVLINGTTPTAAKLENKARFLDPDGPRVLVASTAISKGVNLQEGSRHMVFAESPDSTIERRQMERRILREGGLPGSRYYYDVVTRDGNDAMVGEAILESLRTGKNLHDVLVDGVKK